MTADSAFYTLTDGGAQATVNTRGPWSPDHQHAGPPAALLARALERKLPEEPAMQIVRISYEILRPVPIATLQIRTETRHSGRKLRVLEATLSDCNNKPLMLARAVAIRRSETVIPAPPSDLDQPRSPDDSDAFEFDFFSHLQGYNSAMELRLANRQTSTGRVAMWMRMRLPLVEQESPSPLQRVVIAADSGNGVSSALSPSDYTFINPDLTVYLHRLPEGEWVCLQAQSLVQPYGIGLADTRLFDELGTIGRSDQSLIIEAR